MPAIAGQIEAIERVGWRLEFFSESRQFRIAGGTVTAELHVDEDLVMTVKNFTRSHRPFITLDLATVR